MSILPVLQVVAAAIGLAGFGRLMPDSADIRYNVAFFWVAALPTFTVAAMLAGGGWPLWLFFLFWIGTSLFFYAVFVESSGIALSWTAFKQQLGSNPALLLEQSVEGFKRYLKAPIRLDQRFGGSLPAPVRLTGRVIAVVAAAGGLGLWQATAVASARAVAKSLDAYPPFSLLGDGFVLVVGGVSLVLALSVGMAVRVLVIEFRRRSVSISEKSEVARGLTRREAWRVVAEEPVHNAVAHAPRELPMLRGDTQPRVFLAYFLLGLLLLASFAGSFRTLTADPRDGSTFRVIAGIVAGLPLPIGLIAYVVIPTAIRRAYRATVSGDTQFGAAVVSACRNGKIRPPEVLVSRIPFLSPEVFGTMSRSYLIVPRNVDGVFEALSRSAGASVAAALRHFVVAHEAAHLAHADYRMFTWLGVFLRLLMMFWWPALLATWLAATIAVPEQASAGRLLLGAYGVLLPGMVIGLLYWNSAGIIRDRELLADARAFRTLSESDRRNIGGGDSTGKPLEPLFTLFGAAPGPALGLALNPANPARSTWRRALSRLLRRHPERARRVAILSSGIDPAPVAAVESGISIGFIVGLLLLGWQLAKYAVIAPLMATVGYLLQASFLLLSGAIVGLMLALPVKLVQAERCSFREFDRLLLRKTAVALLCAWCLVEAIALPVVGGVEAGAAWLLLAGIAGAGYVFAILVLMALDMQKSLPWKGGLATALIPRLLVGIVLVTPLAKGGWIVSAVVVWIALGMPLPAKWRLQ